MCDISEKTKQHLRDSAFEYRQKEWLDSHPCYTCEEGHEYCECANYREWYSKKPIVLQATDKGDNL